MHLDRCSHVSVDFNGVANLNSKEQKITCQPFMPSTVQQYQKHGQDYTEKMVLLRQQN